jgi:hypothetical protein
VLSKNVLSVLVPILEEAPGWNALQIRDLFSSCGVAIHESIAGFFIVHGPGNELELN